MKASGRLSFEERERERKGCGKKIASSTKVPCLVDHLPTSKEAGLIQLNKKGFVMSPK